MISSYLLNILRVVLTVRGTTTAPDPELLRTLHEKAEEILLLLERKVSPAIFIESIGKIQQKLLSRKNERKVAISTLAILDPSAYSAHKVKIYFLIVFMII